jgi:hypothetical protein
MNRFLDSMKMSRFVPMQFLTGFRQRQEGVAFIEFAIALPFLLILLLGGIEVTRYVLIVQKVEKAASTISDVVAQASALSQNDLDNIITAGGQVMEPYSFGSNGYVIISSVTQVGTPAGDNPPIIKWQYGGGGTWVQPSQIGTTGGVASLPSGLALNDADNIIIAEVFYNYQPMLVNNIISSGSIYRMSLYKPRFGALTTLSYLQMLDPRRGLL